LLTKEGNGTDVIHEQMLTIHDDDTTPKYKVRTGLSNLSGTDSLQRQHSPSKASNSNYSGNGPQHCRPGHAQQVWESACKCIVSVLPVYAILHDHIVGFRSWFDIRCWEEANCLRTLD